MTFDDIFLLRINEFCSVFDSIFLCVISLPWGHDADIHSIFVLQN